MAIIQTQQSDLHWNYFLALERDLEMVSRYIEFSPANFPVYSIELAHLLFAAASEVDVLAKILCKLLVPASNPSNINQYAAIITKAAPQMVNEKVFLPRYNLSFSPWDNWLTPQAPFWWRSYNQVKHQRDTFFNEATLENALRALGGLLVMLFYVRCQRTFNATGSQADPRQVMDELDPQSTLLRLSDAYYFKTLAV